MPMQNCARARGEEPLRVAIVGGGVAGATIADTLSESHANWKITLVEKGRYVAQGDCVPHAACGERRAQN